MKVLIVDDEAPARERLRRLLAELAEAEVAWEAGDGVEALRRCAEQPLDVILLDIRMPGMDGLETARHLATLESMPAVIFVTAHGDHALDAFEAQAVDYLLKPVRIERLRQALERARRLTHASLATIGGRPPPRTHLTAYVHGALKVIPVAEVFYFQAGQKYVTVRYPGGEVLIEAALKAIEEEFGGAFVRIHRNGLVARDSLIGMESDGEGHYYACLRETTERLEISRRHAPDVRRLLRSGRLAG